MPEAESSGIVTGRLQGHVAVSDDPDDMLRRGGTLGGRCMSVG
ncbi:hypothetical protein STAFG_6465 [Streptomyces afghaniensis 772]|uniref:Uncharacterized protein n=1 Tax=Streptomyces afghaniensis 772 TaxID=1283301 RepID=S4MAM4_9ACTN|nr:hypothetical protein [Streptomyces afghaniensis]EPJ36458.1 hypothetical protein STAFG_6465 [Streptomyces afghaniensis 772]